VPCPRFSSWDSTPAASDLDWLGVGFTDPDRTFAAKVDIFGLLCFFAIVFSVRHHAAHK
jgi:hypothetical protein